MDLVIISTGQMYYQEWNAYCESKWTPDPRILGYNVPEREWTLACPFDASMGIIGNDVYLDGAFITFPRMGKRMGVVDPAWYYAKEYLNKYPGHRVGIICYSQSKETKWGFTDRAFLQLKRIFGMATDGINKSKAQVVLWYQRVDDDSTDALNNIKKSFAPRGKCVAMVDKQIQSPQNVPMGWYRFEVENTNEIEGVRELGARAFFI